MFEKLDLNNDGKISLREFTMGVECALSNDRVFKQLDSDSDGALDFDDILVLFYYKRDAITVLRCDGCRELSFGPTFSCFECSRDRSYALCCNCYGGGKFPHRHPLLHDQALLAKLSKATAKVSNFSSCLIFCFSYTLTNHLVPFRRK